MCQRDAGGDRDVEALGESGHRNAEGARAGGEGLRRWTFVLVAEQQGHGTVGGQFAVEPRRSIEMSCPYLEAALAEPPRGLCAARVALVVAQDSLRQTTRTGPIRRTDRRDPSHPRPWRAAAAQVWPIGCASRSRGAGTGAESSARMVASSSSSRPSPVAPETRWTSILRRFSFLRSAWARSRASGMSILFAAAICGLRPRAGSNSSNS